MKVLISDSLSEQGVTILKKAGLEVDIKTKLTPAELIQEIGQYDGLVIRSGTKVTKEVIAAAKNLKVIGRAGSGLDNVDVPAATKRGIVVMNTPGGNTITTAEHTFALIFSMARQTPQANASVKSGKWEKNKFMGIELFDKTLGIVGLGQIGSWVARLAQGAGMKVIAFDTYLSQDIAQKMGVTLVDLATLYAKSDIITLHTPMTAETKYLINAEAIAKMKDGVRIVNCARGGIVDEAALLAALTSGKVAASASDVFEKEPVDPNHPLLKLDNFICTPHLGAATLEAQENVALAIADQVVDYLVRGVVRYAVNLPSISLDLIPKVQPYVLLAEKIGSFIGQTIDGGITAIHIEYHGEAAELQSAPMHVAALKGLLAPILEETVNYVNAPAIAKERGIEVKETKSDNAGNFASLLTMKVTTSTGKKIVSGSVFHKTEPRFIEVDGVALEIIPEGNMLYIHNNDKPGVIGDLGQLLAKNQINVSRMQLGREQSGGLAISVVGIDLAASESLLKEIRTIPNVLSVKPIKL
jgi:D-3-phosphoglycerate dehydrogenase